MSSFPTIPNLFSYILIFAVVSQAYTANVMDESVLKGNTAILKCHIPSFVSDFVTVVSWLQEDGDEILVADDGRYGALFFHI